MDRQYDVVIVGGGLGGCALGRALASRGVRTLILERDRVCRDRVRGEQLQPWGVAEADRLGLLELLRETCGHDQGWFDTVLGGTPMGHRDLRATTLPGQPGLNFYHPDMQEVMLQAASGAGVAVWRGAAMREVERGSNGEGAFRIHVDHDGRSEQVRARLLVGADGRGSAVRRQAGFETRRDPPFLLIAGILADGIPADDRTAFVYVNPTVSQTAAIFPQGNGRARLYTIYPETAGFRLQGEKDIPRFVDAAVRAGTPSELFTDVDFSGPLASFDSADTWVDGPYRNGIALIGDAAASSDPSWGQGLSLTLRDARTLADFLLAGDDWDEAGKRYAQQHDQYYGVLHGVTAAMTEMFVRSGPMADARRARALPRIAEDPTRVPDHVFSGPDLPWNEDLRRRFFGED